MSSTDRLVDRIRAEYLALPGLKLTSEQACRLWAVDDDRSRAAFEVLLAEGFLHRTGTGKYVALPRPSGLSVSTDHASSPAVRCSYCRKLNTIQREPRVPGAAVTTTFRCIACHRVVSVTEMPA